MDRPRGACSGDAGSAGVSGGWLAIELPQETVVALEGFAARCGATLFMVLLAALQLLLGALCGQDDVVVRPLEPYCSPSSSYTNQSASEENGCRDLTRDRTPATSCTAQHV